MRTISMRFFLLIPLLYVFSACSSAEETSTSALPASAYLDLSDADSGYIRGIEPQIHFRLHNVDAPEDRSPNQRGGAKCLEEQAMGDAAGAYARELVQGATIEITARYGPDRYQREVIDLSINGEDMGALLIAAGHAGFWDYDGGDPNPDWCPQ